MLRGCLVYRKWNVIVSLVTPPKDSLRSVCSTVLTSTLSTCVGTVVVSLWRTQPRTSSAVCTVRHPRSSTRYRFLTQPSCSSRRCRRWHWILECSHRRRFSNHPLCSIPAEISFSISAKSLRISASNFSK